jgi:superfamily I DNA/RNA helicase
MYDDVIIDEYQDLTACEQQLVELVWSRVGSLVVLGDDDQSVYGFRFNHPEGITGFPGHWQDVEDIAFPDNRRCATSIVEIANQLMAEAGSTKDPMVARAADEGSAAFVQWPSVEEEIAGLADFVGSRPDDEFLILVPRRFIGYRLQEAIGADARTAFRQEVLEHPLTQERFTLASLLADSEDRVAFRAWLCFHGDQPTKPTGRNADAYSSFSASGASPMDIARDIVSGAIRVRGTGSTHIRERASRMVTELATAPGDFHELVDYIFNPDLADTLPADLADEKRRWVRSDLEQIRDAALKIRDEDEDATLAQVIRVLRYRIATRAPLSEEQPARVNIMTLHSAKGLEADAIIVAGLADQIVPGPPDQDPQTNDNQRAEQRRLLYVAVTRAKNELVVSWPRSVAYADASVNRIRIDAGSIRSYGSGRRVQLTRSSLLPDDLPGATPGRAWLKSRSG